MKLHLGCGNKYLSGYVNIDAIADHNYPKVPDLVLRDLSVLPFDDNSINEIMAIHLFEHFYLGDVDGILKEWVRVLKPGGRLILEMPDIIKSAKNLIKEMEAGKPPSNKWAMWPIYGDNPRKTEFDCHKWGWTFATLTPRLIDAGFSVVTEAVPQYHGRKTNRDFRIEAVK